MAIIGAILGDIIGSVFEFKTPDTYDYKTVELLTEDSHFTDDTVLSLATKSALDTQTHFAELYHCFGNKYLHVGYGQMFEDWLTATNPQPYGSYGNGSAMRVAPVVDHFNDIGDVQFAASLTAQCTHNHPEGDKGAVVAATCIWMAKDGYSKDDILAYAIACYPSSQYVCSPFLSLDEMRSKYKWSATCQASVPLAVRCVYEANSFEEFMRNVISIDCDADTIGAIGGAIAEELFDNQTDDILQHKNEYMKKYLDEFLYNVLYSSADGNNQSD